MAPAVGRLREQIDLIDAELLDLLNRRAEVALELGRHKREAGLEIRDARREDQILTRARALNSGPLDPEAVERLFCAILDESRRAQSKHAETGRAESSRIDLGHQRSRRATRATGTGRMRCA